MSISDSLLSRGNDMSYLYISKFKDTDGTEKYGLFSDDVNGKRWPFEEDWKHVAFMTEDEARIKLESLAEERKREDSAEPFSEEEAERFVESLRWKFATTYAKTAPHEYIVKSWLTEEEKLDYERFVSTMKKNFVTGYFYGHKNNYFILGDHYYWYMGQHDNMAVDLINRTTVDYLEYRDGAYYYKGTKEDGFLSGEEPFSFENKETGMSIRDFWKWHFSDIYDLQEKIAEFIVAKALGRTKPDNAGSWTLFDIAYEGKRIEVKETSYYHSWQTDEEHKSEQRTFKINKAYSVYGDNTSELARQNDIYVFCLNTGDTKASSNPLQLEHWEFYVIPTAVIDRECGDGKTISLSRVRKMTEKVDYMHLKEKIDKTIADME